MRYQSTTGLATEQIEELAARIWQIVQCRKSQPWPPSVGLYRAVVLTLVYVRQNLNQAAVGDLFGISQSTVSRVYRGMLPLIEQALCLHIPDLKDFTREKAPIAFLVRQGNDFSFLPYQRYDRQLNYSRFDVGGTYSASNGEG